MSRDLIEDDLKQIKASVKQNRGKFNDDSSDNIDHYSHQTINGIKRRLSEIPSEDGVTDPLTTRNKSSLGKKR